MDLKETYKTAAQKAFEEGIDANDEEGITIWIRNNCSYRPDTEFFVYFGVACALADFHAQAKGFENEVHRAWEEANRR